MPQKLTTTACFIQEESSGGKPPSSDRGSGRDRQSLGGRGSGKFLRHTVKTGLNNNLIYVYRCQKYLFSNATPDSTLSTMYKTLFNSVTV